MESTSTLLTLLEIQVAHQPDASAVTWLYNGETPAGSLTFLQLAQQARTVASRLLQFGVMPGERVLLVYSEGIEFLPAFLGCLYAGIVAVPTPAPDALRGKRTLPHMQAVSADADACLVLTTQSLKDLLPASPILTTDDLPTGEYSGDASPLPEFPVIQRHQLAYLQYTSGSTGTPKGVMISHGNVLANLEALNQAWGYTAHSAALTWMPHTHDFGLVEGLLHPLTAGVPSYIMAPGAFLRRPLRWLEAISRLRVTNSAAATFAYQHCLQHFDADQCANLDLSCWRIAALGAEPIRPALLTEFATAFAPFGFDRNALCPGYGLAEGTLIATARGLESELVTCSLTSEIEGHVTMLAGCGPPRADTAIQVVDPMTYSPLSEGEVGEIWVAGDSVAQGYWQRPEETLETFGAALNGTKYLRTGDLGLLKGGVLFISGRLKDLLILHGQNVHPSDIEWSVEEAHPLLKTGSKAAFALEDPLAAAGAERLAVVCEVDHRAAKSTDLAEVVQAIRERVGMDFLLTVHMVTLIRRGTLPKTPSGKVQRLACRAIWLKGDLESLFTWQLDPDNAIASGNLSLRETPAGVMASKTPSEELLAQIWCDVLGVKKVGIHDNFFALGGNSLRAVSLFARIEQAFDKRLPLTILFEKATIREIAALLDEEQVARVWQCLAPVQTQGERPPFFCPNIVGPDLLNLRTLSRYLAPDQPLYSFEAQVVYGEKLSHATVEGMAMHYLPEMRSIQPHGPYYLGGVCAGGVIAFEMACQLVAQGERVAVLAIWDSFFQVEPAGFSTDRIRRRLRWLDGQFGNLVLNDRGTVFRYLDRKTKGNLRGFRARIRRQLSNSAKLDLFTWLHLVSGRMRAIITSYRPGRYPGRVTQFLTRDKRWRTALDPRLLVSELADGGVEVHFIDGDHISMMQEPHVRVLAAKLQECLDRAAAYEQLRQMAEANHKSHA